MCGSAREKVAQRGRTRRTPAGRRSSRSAGQSGRADRSRASSGKSGPRTEGAVVGHVAQEDVLRERIVEQTPAARGSRFGLCPVRS